MNEKNIYNKKDYISLKNNFMDKIKREEFSNHNDIFWYIAPDGYYFTDAYGINYGNRVVCGRSLNKSYRLARDKGIEDYGSIK